jgi:hypothetical protein
VSNRSASTPANSSKQKTGSVVGACTCVTTAGPGLSVVISKSAPAACINVAVFDISVAVHNGVKALWPIAGTAPAGAGIPIDDIDQSLAVVQSMGAHQGAKPYDMLALGTGICDQALNQGAGVLTACPRSMLGASATESTFSQRSSILSFRAARIRWVAAVVDFGCHLRP